MIKTIFKNLLLIMFSLIIGLLLAEGFVRLFIASSNQWEIISEIKAYKTSTGNPYKFYDFDSELGWKNKSNYRGIFQRDEFKHEVTLNNERMRDKEVSRKKQKNKQRIAVMGDSFTWGVGVKDSERFTNIIDKNNNNYEVLNFGVSGYGPLTYFLQLDNILKFNPDIVLIAFCLGNDFSDNVFYRRYSYYGPFTVLSNNPKIEVHGYPLPQVNEFYKNYQFIDFPLLKSILKNSKLYSLIHSYLSREGYIKQKFYEHIHTQLGHIGADEFQRDIYYPNFQSESSIYKDDMSFVNKKILSKIKDILVEKNIKFSVVVAPTKCEYGGCYIPYDYKNNNHARNLLLNNLKDLKIDYIDSTDSLTLKDFWEKDGHWRPSGHNKIADGVLKWLSK